MFFDYLLNFSIGILLFILVLYLFNRKRKVEEIKVEHLNDFSDIDDAFANARLSFDNLRNAINSVAPVSYDLRERLISLNTNTPVHSHNQFGAENEITLRSSINNAFSSFLNTGFLKHIEIQKDIARRGFLIICTFPDEAKAEIILSEEYLLSVNDEQSIRDRISHALSYSLIKNRIKPSDSPKIKPPIIYKNLKRKIIC